MATGVNINNAVDPVLTGLFNSPILEDGELAGAAAAPIETTDGLSAQWAELSSPTDSRMNLQTEPLSIQALDWESPSRETGWTWGTSSADLLRYAEKIVLEDRIVNHARVSHGLSLAERSATLLGARSARRFNYLVMRVGYASGNFTTTDSTVGDLDTLSTTFVDHVQDGQWTAKSLTDARLTDAFCNEKVAQRLTINDSWQTYPHAGNVAGGVRVGASTPGNNYAGIRDAWRGLFGLELHIDRDIYTDSSGTVTTVMADDIALVRLATDGTPTFMTTWAERTGLDQPGLGSVYTVRTDDPRGEKIIADVAYVVDPRNADCGVLLTNVI